MQKLLLIKLSQKAEEEFSSIISNTMSWHEDLSGVLGNAVAIHTASLSSFATTLRFFALAAAFRRVLAFGFALALALLLLTVPPPSGGGFAVFWPSVIAVLGHACAFG